MLDLQPTPDPQPTTKNPRYPGPKGIPIERIIDLRSKGMTLAEIGKLLNIHEQNVFKRLKAVNYQLELTDQFKKHRSKVLTWHQHRISQAITDADIAKAKLIDKVKAMSFLHNQERLEDGLSTANVAYADLVKLRQQTKAEMSDIEARFGRPETTDSGAK